MVGRDQDGPVVAWDPETGQLAGPDGAAVTDAQDAKARAYVDGKRVRLVTATSTVHAWGEPSSTTETYALDPIPGCRQERRVVVTSVYDAAGNLTRELYRCDCQKARGTVAMRAGTCSHTLATHRWRRLPRQEAAPA